MEVKNESEAVHAMSTIPALMTNYLLSGDSGTLDMEDKSIPDRNLKPPLGNCDVSQSGSSRLSNRSPICLLKRSF